MNWTFLAFITHHKYPWTSLKLKAVRSQKKNRVLCAYFVNNLLKFFVSSRITTGHEHQCQWTMGVTHHKVWMIGRNSTVCHRTDNYVITNFKITINIKYSSLVTHSPILFYSSFLIFSFLILLMPSLINIIMWLGHVIYNFNLKLKSTELISNHHHPTIKRRFAVVWAPHMGHDIVLVSTTTYDNQHTVGDRWRGLETSKDDDGAQDVSQTRGTCFFLFLSFLLY